MTNELEKQFFDTFGIEPKLVIRLEDWEKCKDLPRAEELFKHYPQITNLILLELICIVLNVFETFEVYRIMDIDSLKEKILRLSMLAKDDVYLRVRTLFEEG